MTGKTRFRGQDYRIMGRKKGNTPNALERERDQRRVPFAFGVFRVSLNRSKPHFRTEPNPNAEPPKPLNLKRIFCSFSVALRPSISMFFRVRMASIPASRRGVAWWGLSHRRMLNNQWRQFRQPCFLSPCPREECLPEWPSAMPGEGTSLY